MELDTSIFDEELDTKKARRYDAGLKFAEGVDADFKAFEAG